MVKKLPDIISEHWVELVYECSSGQGLDMCHPIYGDLRPVVDITGMNA